MGTSRDPDGEADEGPSLRLVPDVGQATERPGDSTAAPAQADMSEPVTTDAAGDGAAPPRPGADFQQSSSDPRHGVEVARDALAAVDPVAYYRSLTALVRPSHSSVLQELPYSPGLSFHDPTQVVVEPDPTNVETVELYARAAYPDFDRVLVAAFADPMLDGLLSELYHLLVHERVNVALVTNHGQIIDIALVIAALESAMLAPGRQFGVLGEQTTMEELGERTNVLVSRMVTTRQAFNVPAVQVLQSAARTFLTVPQTANRRRSKLEPALVRANNRVMRHELDEQLARGGQLLAMAASGSQDLTLPEVMQKVRAAWRQRRGDDPGESSTLHLQPLYDGTVSLMQSCRYVLPVAICLDPSSPACVIGGITRLREADDCHRVMDWIALAHQQATGVPTIYHWHEDDLLTQVRTFLQRSGHS